MANVRISQLPTAPDPIDGSELVPIVQNGQTVQTTVNDLISSPSLTQTFLTKVQEPSLPNSRYLGVGSGLSISDAGAQNLLQISPSGALASLVNSGTGIQVKTDATTLTNRSIATSGNGLSITNGSGVSGNPTLALSGLPATLANTVGTGLLAIGASTTLTPVTITGTSNQISIANGNGSGGNPTISIASNPIIPGTAAMQVPSGTTAERPAGTNGQLRYNTDTGRFEVYDAGWVNIGLGDGNISSVAGTANQIVVVNGSTAPIISIDPDPTIPGTAGMVIPVGTTAERSAGPDGSIRYNTDTGLFEGYSVGVWTSFAAGSGVTSVATGSGLLGGPITSTGTITIDTTIVATLSGSQTLTNKTISGASNTITNIDNASLVNSAITINGSSVSLGGSVTVTAVATNALTIGTGLSGTSYNGSAAVTIAIANTGVSAATYGSASSVPVFAVNAQGQITSVTNTAISIASSAITDKGLANGLATLDGSGTVPTSQLPAAVLGALKYQGVWNASTNTPTLASGVGTQGYYYVVDVAGSTNLDGITSWNVGDWAIYSGTAWQKIDNTDAVTSVNGYTGTVVLSYSDVGAPSATGTGASGTWSISINGNAATATSATTATTATNVAGGAAGSLLYQTGAGATTSLALGTTNYVLTAGASAPQYVAQSTLSVGSATDATNAVNTGITSNSTNANYYLTFVSATTGNLPQLVNSGLTVNPSTAMLTSGVSGGTF